ncbi:MAG: CdvA-like protein [Candidatus Bathyarchaeota archaeon]|nr:CdvA-like protein [Candidatus Bathyarchaeota archaeon]
MSQPSNLFLSIGKPVKDEYGRSVGRIITFATSPSGKLDFAFIESSDGRFTKQPIEDLVFDGTEVTLNSKIKSKAAVFCDQIPFIWRKDEALKDLADKKKISPELYNELHGNFSSILSQLRRDAQSLSDDITNEIDRCEEELKALSYGVLHLELEHEIGKIAEDVYKSAFGLMQEHIRRANAEKSDLESIRAKLSNMLLGDSPPPEPETPPAKAPEQKTTTVVETEPEKPKQEQKQEESKPQEAKKEEPKKEPAAADSSEASDGSDLPEPPVVVYVKEVGKAGI